MTLLQQNTMAAATQGISLLDTLPPEEEHLFDLITLRAQFLNMLGQGQRAQAILLDHVIAMESEELWLQRGSLLVDWLAEHKEGDVHEATISMLRNICQTHNFLAPSMILASALSQGHERPPVEARELYKEILLPKRWRKHPKRIAFWLEHLAGGFFSYIDLLTTREQHKEARRYGRMILGFPWHKFPSVFTQNAMHLLCLSLFQLELWTEQKQLCEKVRRVCPTWSEPHYWLGTLAILRDNAKQALDHFHKAITLDGLDEVQKRSILSRLMSAGVVEGLDEFFEAFKDKDHLDTLRLSVLYHLYRDELEEALHQCDAIVAMVPNDLSAQLYTVSLLEALQRWDEAEAHLRSWLTESQPTLFVFGHLLLGNLCLQTQRHDEALHHLKTLAEGPFPYQTILNKQWQRSFLLLYGESLQSAGDTQGALSRYQEAHSLGASGPLFTRMIWLLIRLERWEDAEKMARQARPHSTNLPWFQCATLQLHEHFERWESCLEVMEQLELPWFQQQGILREGLLTKVRTLMACNKPWEALVCCETWLDFIMQDPELKEIRQQVFHAAQSHVKTMQQQLGKQAQKIVELDDQKNQWKQQQWEHQKREELFHKVVQQEGLHQEMRSLQQRNTWLQQHASMSKEPGQRTSWEREHPERFESLSDNAKALLSNAALLWDSLAPYPEQDHGPVVLQIARVVETEVYRCLLAPLLTLADQQGIKTSELPALSTGDLATTQHRISLADAGSLLYTHLEVQEPDGSTTVMRNPRSTPAQKQLLNAFWRSQPIQQLPSSTQRYLQSQLPLDLVTLARQRNLVSHANHGESPTRVLHRQKAKAIFPLVWGHQKQEGILSQLSWFSA